MTIAGIAMGSMFILFLCLHVTGIQDEKYIKKRYIQMKDLT